MPTIANTPLLICSRASLLIGGDAISSFTDSTAEATVANSVYEDIAQGLLTSTRWRFASKQAQLSRNSTAPLTRWDASYALPTDSLMISTITIQDLPIDYDIYEGNAFCNATTTDTVIADYIFRADEDNWPSYFITGVELSVASMLAMSVARDASMSVAFEQKAERQLAKARNLDSQQQTTRKLNTSRFIAERRS
tara:strand:+ start:203 stop:787 length:585 start_codon:yes stop_codon:yes gene_type:complete